MTRCLRAWSRGAAFVVPTSLAILGIGIAQAQDPLAADAGARFGRLEPVTAVTSAEIELGRALYWDPRLSADGKTACATCHPAQDWGADRRRASIDARGQPTSRNSPTIFNALRQPTLRWLGDRRTGAEQAEGSITGSLGFRSKDELVPLLRRFEYAGAFRAAYPGDAEPMSASHYGRAIAAYEATLITPAPFDRYLGGDVAALTARQKDGLRLFMERGCAGCHDGALVGGTAFRRFGIVKPYGSATGSTQIDEGRYAITKKDEDRHVFRVPMLRNVAKTAPYFHDGSVSTLDGAVRVMASVQLGQMLSDSEVAAIVAFLESLTGDVPANYAPPEQRSSP